MTDIAEFLLARIAEDETVAHLGSANGEYIEPWTASYNGVTADSMGLVADTFDDRADPEPTAAHIARWDPVRVLAECEAKRAIVEAFIGHDSPESGRWLLTVLAVPYADHPDFDESWRP